MDNIKNVNNLTNDILIDVNSNNEEKHNQHIDNINRKDSYECWE